MPNGLIHTPRGKNTDNNIAISNVEEYDSGSDGDGNEDVSHQADQIRSNNIEPSNPQAGSSNPNVNQSPLEDMKLCVTNTPVNTQDFSQEMLLEQMTLLRVELESLRAKQQATESTPRGVPNPLTTDHHTHSHMLFPSGPEPRTFDTYRAPRSPRLARPIPQSRPSLVVHWNLRFSGRADHLTAEEFLHRIELRAQDSGVSLNELCSNVVSLLQGDALEWYWSQFRHYCRCPTWRDFRELFLSQYREVDFKFSIYNKMLELKQGSDAFDDYFNKMNSLHNRLEEPMQEPDYVKILVQNLNTRLGPLVIGRGVNSVYELRRLCIETERWYEANKPERKLPYRIHEVNAQPECYCRYEVDSVEPNPGTRLATHPSELSYTSEYQISSQVEELRSVNPNVRRVLTCWNCQQGGHTFHDCPSEKRHLFCYKCGKAGVVTPKCPSCNSGNQQRGVMNRGITHPESSITNRLHP